MVRVKVRRAFTVVLPYNQAHSFVASVKKQVRKDRLSIFYCRDISTLRRTGRMSFLLPSAASLLLHDPAVSSYLSTGAKYLLLKMKRITFHPQHCSRRHLACVRGASVCMCVCVCVCVGLMENDNHKRSELFHCLRSPTGEVSCSEFHMHISRKVSRTNSGETHTLSLTHTRTHTMDLPTVCAMCRRTFSCRTSSSLMNVHTHSHAGRILQAGKLAIHTYTAEPLRLNTVCI